MYCVLVKGLGLGFIRLQGQRVERAEKVKGLEPVNTLDPVQSKSYKCSIETLGSKS